MRRQNGQTCVATTLAMLTGESPEAFIGTMNTQDPVSWSETLRPYGMKLAYCPTDLRRLRFYAAELVAIDDLFLLCYYSPVDSRILNDPRDDGWVCGSHVVTLLRHRVYDTQSGHSCDLEDHGCLDHFTKRIFRVVPADHMRGL